MNIKEVIAENKRRNDILDEPYDPIKGLGSPLERRKLPISDVTMYVPISMLDDNSTEGLIVKEMANIGSIGNFCSLTGHDEEDAMKIILNLRMKHDFEFWAASCIKILDKDKFIETPFILRKAQRKLLKEMEAQRLADKPIRIVLLKARQWGGSTLVQIYMMWIQQMHKLKWHMAVCAHEDPAAANISEMYKFAAKHYPEEVGSITFKPYARSPKNDICVERGSIIGVGSVNNPDQFRSFNYAMCHLSEVGVWKNTPGRKASFLISSLKETVPDVPYSVIVEESTAKGINYFYDSWKRAIAGETRYKAVFVAWHEIDRCRVPLSVSIEEFWKKMNDYDHRLWSLGATLEGINWYNLHKADRYSSADIHGGAFTEYQMFAENPSTAEEAFQSAGEKRFNPTYIKAMEQDCIDPAFIGDVFADASSGNDAFKHIEFVENARGNLRIWSFPDSSVKVTNRYCAYADIAGIWKGADYSVLIIIDRYAMIEGGDPEIAAVWHGRIDKDLFGWKCAQICTLYDTALLAIETNFYDKDRRYDDHFQTVVEKIADYYPNLYVRNDPEKVGDKYVPRYGFQMNKKTKPTIINSLHSASRERFLKDSGQQDSYSLIVRDSRIINEMMWFEIKPDGRLGAIDGEHDDLVVSAAGAFWLSTQYMPLPKEVIVENTIRVRKQRNEASF